MTPYEMSLHIKDYNFRQEESIRKYELEQKDKIILAWANAAWSQMGKKMPSLKKVLGDTEKVEQTEDQMLETIKKINAKMGGRIF